MIDTTHKEVEFIDQFIKKPLRWMTILDREVRLYKINLGLSMEIDQRDVVGKIDLLFRYYGAEYVCEVKYTNSSTEFWSALKVLGYTTYYNWLNNKKAKPAIMMPKKNIGLEQMIIANNLKIKLFGITETDGNYLVEEIKDGYDYINHIRIKS